MRALVPRLRDAAISTALVTACLGIGIGIAAALGDPTVVNAHSLGYGALVVTAIVSLAAYQWTRRSPGRAAGPGVLLGAAALAGAALLGLVNGGVGTATVSPETAPYFGVGVTVLLVAGLLTATFARARTTELPSVQSPDPFRSRAVTGAAWGSLSLALLNLATGTIPILATNVDDTRFRGGGGVVDKFWVWIIGGVEWVVLLGVVVLIVRRRPSRSSLLVSLLSVVVLVALAGRSFILLVGLSAILVMAMLGRLSLGRLMLLATTGLLLLALAGLARIEASDPTGQRRQYLQENHLSGLGGVMALSASTGPWVFGQSLQAIPEKIPYQHGTFFLRDMRAQLPFGNPQRSDWWITDAVLQRDPTAIGGSPPTLVGGLYVDFGLVGIVLGCALIGAGLALLFQWARAARTFGALSLYGYLSAYVALAAYSYVSLKPTVLAVVALCLMTHRVERAMAAAPLAYMNPLPVSGDEAGAPA